ncbi:N-acetyltransferase [Capsulimonas corticalis]|uniref:N-acetyltransferase n=1 Tax=Capsulimonas corticalis TaxID=2219043 RepID=A0A402D3A5_9BACT|nr:GNAT family N-acetyltransferase [Capsulimonas corticalis]BDI28514.1 N-acetyltransferase [Capsulimonas corticalis]
METPIIRRAERADADSLISLITALADFERLPPPDADARARLIDHGFGDRPKFEAYLAEIDGAPGPVGYAFIFETYSTFLAKPTLYLEDLFVLPDHRKRGVGKALLSHCIALAHERGCGRMEWTCLDWNVNAQKVYEGLGANRMKEWYLYRLMIEGDGAI